MDGSGNRDAGIRLAEIVAALSLATDLGRGQPMEHTIRQTVIAMRLADQMGLDEVLEAIADLVDIPSAALAG